MRNKNKLTLIDVEALQREWDIQDNSRVRERQIIRDQLYPDKPKQKKPPPKNNNETVTTLEDDRWLKVVSGIIIEDPIQREVDTMNGSSTVANFCMEGVYGIVKVSLWNQQAEEIMNYTTGDRIAVTNVQVKPLFNGVQQIGGSRNTRITETEDEVH